MYEIGETETASVPAAASQSETRLSSKTAVIYLRVSTQNQANRAVDPEGYSIPGQREACQRYAASLGASVIEEYVEPGKSGTNTNRPALQRMLSELGTRRPDFVIFYDLSRVARDDFDALWLLREIEGHGCKLESTLERVDDTPAGKLLYTVMAGVNAFRSRGDAEKVKLGLERKHLAGGAHGPARLGYLNVHEEIEGRRIASIGVDPVRGPLLKLLFDLAATGDFTVTSLTAMLDAAGLRTRATATRPSRPVARTTIHRILHDDFYIGVVTRKGVKVTGRHEPLISGETFRRVQAVLSAHRAGGERSQKHRHYLNGSLYCGVCDAKLGFGRHRGKQGRYYEYYSCLSRVRPGGTCRAPYARVHRIEERVEELHDKPLLSARQQTVVSDAVTEFVARRAESAAKAADHHTRRMRELESQQEKLLQLYYRGGVSDDVMQREQARIDAEKIKAERWHSAAQVQQDEVQQALDEALYLISRPALAYRLAAPAVRKLMNRAIFERLEVSTDDGDTDTAGALTEVYRQMQTVAEALVPEDPGGHGEHGVRRLERKNPGPASQDRGSHFDYMAEREGFEPSVEGLPLQQFSRPA